MLFHHDGKIETPLWVPAEILQPGTLFRTDEGILGIRLIDSLMAQNTLFSGDREWKAYFRIVDQYGLQREFPKKFDRVVPLPLGDAFTFTQTV